jgi:DNA-binding PadR family transcriptional regulator
MSTLGYAILGLLAEKPHTGYELAKRMERPIGYMWTAQHSQIYPELATLQSAGLVRHRVVDGRGPRDTKKYSITASGRAALDAWADSPLTRQPARSELMLRVRTFWLISPQRAAGFIRGVRLDHESQLATYQEEDRTLTHEHADVDNPASPDFAAHATLRAGISYERQLIAWCDWLLERLTVAAAADVAQ